MRLISFLFLLRDALLIALILSLGCSAQTVPKDPNNQLIEGPFNLSAEWQVIRLDKPLKTSPHIQTLDVLLDIDQYEFIEGIPLSEYRVSDFGYKRIVDSIIIKPEVILIDKKNREYRVTFDVTGTHFNKLGDYFLLGYGTSSKDKYYFPKDAEFIAVKIRANVDVKIEHLNWVSAGYFKSPERTWADVHPSKIVSIK
ncbi:MAG: hypothetical protein ACRBCI_13220 [Cellvibrionaceae bacterium]